MHGEPYPRMPRSITTGDLESDSRRVADATATSTRQNLRQNLRAASPFIFPFIFLEGVRPKREVTYTPQGGREHRIYLRETPLDKDRK
jgi:hypothetical protein